MKSTVAPFAALVAYAAAQQGYGYGAPSYESSSSASAPSYESSSSASAPSYSNATMTTSAAPSGTGSSGDCYSKYNDCRVAPDANMAYCASQYASCLGYNPFAGNGTNTVTPAPSDVYVTAVVTSFTTVCPNPTTVTVPCGEGPPQTYTISSSTTLTVTKCPGGCHVPTPVASMPPAQTITAIVSSYTTYCPQPTTITYGPSTSQITTTVSQPTTITIATCPGGCTVTAPVSAITPPAYQPSSPASSSAPVSPVAPSNGTTPSSPTGITPYTGAAEKVMAGGSLMAAAAAAVLFL